MSPSLVGKISLLCAGIGASTWLGLGAVMNALADSTSSLPVYEWKEIARRRENFEAQPFRDELLKELATLFARFEIDPNRTKIGILASEEDSQAASAGSSKLPFGYAYLFIPEGIVLNYSLSRVTLKDGLENSNHIHPNAVDTVLTPPQRYELAHEVAHIALEHHTKRILATAGIIGWSVSIGPILLRKSRLSTRKATVIAATSTLPALLALRWLHRQHEWEADIKAGNSGYAWGGCVFWQSQVARRSPNENVPYYLRTHPYPHERFRLFRTLLADL